MAGSKRDARYWLIYDNVKAKHSDWTISKIHAVAGAIWRNSAA